MTRQSVCLALGILAAALVPSGLFAQKRITLSPGVAFGSTFTANAARSNLSAHALVRGRHALVTLDVEARGVPVRIRGEAMAVSASQNHGPVSLGASFVLPIGGGRFRPYALAGAGVYGVGGVGHPTGWNAGAGAEYRRRAMTVFAEARHHSQTPSAFSLGLRF